MPELPEVEYTRRNLERWMLHARVTAVVTSDARIVRPLTPATFVKTVTGRVVERIERRGKWLRMQLSDEQLLFAHLGMTGWFEHGSIHDEPLRFARVTFEVERKRKRSRVTYVDARRWGQLIASTQELPSWSALGPDPLADGIDTHRLAERIARRKSSIKETVMDQKVLAGIGNIQAIEALWKAGIDPRSPAAALDERDVIAVVRGLRWTLKRTLADLEKGNFGKDNPFVIYGRKGAPCPRCGATLARVILGGRTTTFCSGCQTRRKLTRRA